MRVERILPKYTTWLGQSFLTAFVIASVDGHHETVHPTIDPQYISRCSRSAASEAEQCDCDDTVDARVKEAKTEIIPKAAIMADRRGQTQEGIVLFSLCLTFAEAWAE
jgi:hypothetical protein